MKVLMAVHSNYDNDARVRREAEALTSAGYKVTVVAAWPYNIDSTPVPYHLEGVHVIPITLKRHTGIGRFGEMMFRMYRMIKPLEADVLHAHDPDALLPCLLAKPSGIPVIYDSHEWYPGNTALVGKPLRRRIWEKIEKYGLKRIHSLITVNESIKKLYREYYHYQGHSLVLRNFASIKLSNQTSQTDQKETAALIEKLKSEVPCVAIYSGHITKGRGLPHYLDAIRSNTNWGLIIAGDGSYTPWLQSELEKSDLNHRIKYVGMLPHNRLYPLIQKCDVGLCYIEPISESYYYALPNKLSEYVQLGVPVIGSNLPEIASLIRKFNVGLVAESPSRITECLDRISQKEFNFTESLLSAQKELSWDKEQQMLLQTYQQVTQSINSTVQ